MSWLNAELHRTLRVAIVASVLLAAIWLWTGRLHPSITPTQSVNVAQIAQQVLKGVDLARSVSAPAPVEAGPAITVIHDIPGTSGLSSGEVAALLHALGNQHTQQVVTATAHIAPPTPNPLPSAVPGLTDEEIQAVERADEVAVANVLAKSTIPVDVKVSQEPAPPSRVSSTISSTGAAGVVYALRRRGQLDFDLGAVSNQGRIDPTIAAIYRLKGTSFGIGPSVTFDHGARFGLAFAIGL